MEQGVEALWRTTNWGRALEGRNDEDETHTIRRRLPTNGRRREETTTSTSATRTSRNKSRERRVSSRALAAHCYGLRGGEAEAYPFMGDKSEEPRGMMVRVD